MNFLQQFQGPVHEEILFTITLLGFHLVYPVILNSTFPPGANTRGGAAKPTMSSHEVLMSRHEPLLTGERTT